MTMIARRINRYLLPLLIPAALLVGTTGCQNQRVIASSIKVDRGADLSTLARITPEEAEAAALKRYPGATAEEVKLQDENGYLFYEVDVRNDDQQVEVLVDAGNGAVRFLEWRR